jgi:ribosomal protein S18 acetylase RimI-like enzyme
MHLALVQHASRVRIRPAEGADIGDLVRIEQHTFATDHIPRRGFRRFVASPSSALIVATRERAIVGYALVLFRANSDKARLYSIAVAPEMARRGFGVALLAAAEKTALARDCSLLRLEVHEKNAAAVSRYRKAGYVMFGRHADYYTDHGDALRFEKRLAPRARGTGFAPRSILTLRRSGGGNTSRSSRR